MKPSKKQISEAEQKQIETIQMMGRLADETYRKVFGGDVEKWKSTCMEQASNFLLAGVILQKKQWELAVKCRECDAPDGPKQILSGGGRGSAKSHAILAQIFCDDCQRVKGLKVLCLRKVGKANKEQIQDFRKKLLTNLPHNYREQAQTITFDNGSFVILGNFKDESDLDKYLGLEYDLIYVMECNQLTRTKIVNIQSCLRTNKTNWRPRLYLDTNPGGISHVEHKRIFVEPWKAGKETETRYIHSTVDDNRFVDSGYKEYLEKLVGWQREAWLHGSWEFMAGAFFNNFYPDTHVYPNAQTDLNVRGVVRWFAGLDYGFSHPNAFVLCCEDEGGNIFVTDTYSASSTLIEEHAANIRDLLRLKNLEVEDLEFIAAGRDCFRVDKDGSTVATEYQERGILLTAVHIDRINAWSQVAEVFGDIQHQIRPRCFIHRNCMELVQQIQSAQSDPKKPNDILKMNADAESGEGGDDLLEACFVAGTMVMTEHGEKPIESIVSGEKVWTRQGLKKVLSAGMTRKKAKVIEVEFSHGRNLIGTGNHRIFCNFDWRSLDSLGNDDIVSVCLKHPKQSFLTEENSVATRNQSTGICGTIISQVKSNRLEKVFRSIKKFGNQLMEKSQKGWRFITKTETRLTTELKISKCCQESSTKRNTTVQSEKSGCENTPQQLDRLQRHGTTQKKQATLRKKISILDSGNLFRSKDLLVSIAEKNLTFTPLASSSNSAMSIARLPHSAENRTTLKKGFASFVETSFRRLSIEKIKPSLALASVVESNAAGQSAVFNLEVEDCPEYFANGVLVHNCRNAIVMAYSNLLTDAKPVQMGGYKGLSQIENSGEIIDVDVIIQESEMLDAVRR